MNCEIQIISIEGNIGSGKSTLLAYLKTYFNDHENIIFLNEPVDEWAKITDETGTTILEKFYADQEKYSFSFQMMAYISRLKLLINSIKDIKSSCSTSKINKYFIITERSLYTDKMVFAKMLYDSGKIETINYQIYLNWFDVFVHDYNVNKIIYVNTDPDICYKRIGKRNRNGEDKIPLEYLKNCHTYHNSMLDKSSQECVCNNQLILNGNVDIYENERILNKWVSVIKKFIFE